LLDVVMPLLLLIILILLPSLIAFKLMQSTERGRSQEIILLRLGRSTPA
jgi:hypothetical protein